MTAIRRNDWQNSLLRTTSAHGIGSQPRTNLKDLIISGKGCVMQGRAITLLPARLSIAPQIAWKTLLGRRRREPCLSSIVATPFIIHAVLLVTTLIRF